MSGPELYELIKEISEALAFKAVFVTGDTVSAGMRDFIAATGIPIVWLNRSGWRSYCGPSMSFRTERPILFRRPFSVDSHFKVW